MNSTVVSLAGNVFTVFYSVSSSIIKFYVPASLLNQYKTAQRWSNVSSQIIGI